MRRWVALIEPSLYKCAIKAVDVLVNSSLNRFSVDVQMTMFIRPFKMSKTSKCFGVIAVAN